MREWCGCGSAIHSLSKRQITSWRTNHIHAGREPEQPDKQGSEAYTERRHSTEHGDPYEATARIGFRPND